MKTNKTAKEVNIERGISVPSAVKIAWLAALRSGLYKQGQGRMKTNGDTYCCLGVLEEALDHKVEMNPPDNITPRHAAFPSRMWCHEHDVHMGKDAAFFEPFVTIPSSLPSGGFAGRGDRYIRAATANDSLHMTFEQIADALEEDLPTH